MTNPRFRQALTALSPDEVLLPALEIRHPDAPAPIRVVDNTEDVTIGRYTYRAVRFGLRLASDVEGETPVAELTVDNVGRDLTQWIERAGGAAGATCRIMLVLAARRAIEWEATLDALHIRYDHEQVIARLGFDPLLGRNAVALRYDPQTAPGLFDAAPGGGDTGGHGSDVSLDPPPPPPPPPPSSPPPAPEDDGGGDGGDQGGDDEGGSDDTGGPGEGSDDGPGGGGDGGDGGDGGGDGDDGGGGDAGEG